MIQGTHCPYCKHAQKISHDDYDHDCEEDFLNEKECSACGKNFTFTIEIMFEYRSYKAACLNGEKHKYKRAHTCPKRASKMVCLTCMEEREPTQDEWREIYR